MKKTKKSRLYRQNLKKRSFPYKRLNYKNLEKHNSKSTTQTGENFIMLKHNAEKRVLKRLNKMGLVDFLEFAFKRF